MPYMSLAAWGPGGAHPPLPRAAEIFFAAVRSTGATMRRSEALQRNSGKAGLLSQVKVTLHDPTRRDTMGSVSDRVAGAANSAVGKAKEAIGKETGDAELAAKGAVQDVKGKAQTAIGKGKAAAGE